MKFRFLSRTTLATVVALGAVLGAHAQEDPGFPAATGDPVCCQPAPSWNACSMAVAY
ncbi:MAG: hypothetical protein R3F53_06790 [Gammaproteobacteria bacterium]